LLLIKMTRGEILWFTMRMPELVVPKRLLSFWITIPCTKHVILLIRQISPLRLLTFRISERSALREFIRRIWWTLVRYPGNFQGSRSWDLGRRISRMDDPIVKCINGNGEYIERCLNWNVQFLFLNGRSWDATLRRKTLNSPSWKGPAAFQLLWFGTFQFPLNRHVRGLGSLSEPRAWLLERRRLLLVGKSLSQITTFSAITVWNSFF
jgi:hypothetical protein